MPFRDAMFFMPALEGVEVPTWFQNAWGTLGTSLDGAFRNIGEWASDPSQQAAIEISGAGALTLQEISDYLPTSGTIWPFHGSWAAAATMRGWAICDGSNGTPKIHPAIDDASPIQRMVRATAYGVDSGTTAGTECHCHTGCGSVSCETNHAHCIDGTICCENAHCHYYTCDTETNGDHEHSLLAGYTDTNYHCHAVGTLYTAQSSCCDCTCSAGTDHCFSCHNHCHNVCGQTSNCDDTCCGHHHCLCGCSCCDGIHKHGNDGRTGVGDAHTHLTCDLCTCLAGTHAHTISSHATTCNAHLPRVIDVIWLMKL
jgi:hypothetical protein